MRRRPLPVLAGRVLLATMLGASLARAEDPAPIEDNSFLVEEAYNQEPRVVQHITTWMRPRGGGWEASFTQEWPAGSQRHQLSYTIPIQEFADASGGARGIGDVALNYRFQALGVGGGRIAFAPRISALLATGDSDRGLGAGAPGVQFNLPMSVALSPRAVTHTNAGATWIGIPPPGAVGIPEAPPRATRRVLSFGQSLIWLATQRLNLMLELAWERGELLDVPGDGDVEESLLVAPGLRWAHDFASGLQIVPGIAVPIGVGPSRGERAVFLYLSFEHGF